MHFGIFVAYVEVGVCGLDDPRGDQHALDKAMRIALEVITVLEGAGFAFVAIDRKQARRRLGADQRPFAAGGKAGAAKPAQTGIADDLDQVVARALAANASLEQFIAAGLHIGIKSGRRRIGVPVRRLGCRSDNLLDVGVQHLHMPDGASWRAIAGAHARRTHHAHAGREPLRQLLHHALGTGERAGQ